MSQKPVIFLAFANDKENHHAYLRNLSLECRTILQVLHQAESAGLCEVVHRQGITIGEIIDIFQQYRDSISIFHYGGHADNDRILLEGVDGRVADAHSYALLPFLAKQKGLRLVFFNGCSTQQQAIELVEAGIPIVIGTTQSIDDRIASKLAGRFYTGLSAGLSLQRAWEDATGEALIPIDKSNLRLLYRKNEQVRVERYPWQMEVRPGSETVKDWNLPQAANNPLLGLPQPPQKYDLPDTPFRYLERYRREQADVFFGRSRFIRDLYQLITHPKSAPVILLYGQSGVGKSSLLEAGLWPYLEESHQVKYVRRAADKGLAGTLLAVFDGAADLLAAWKSVEQSEGKPLVVMLDQVEEVFTMPNPGLPDELRDFVTLLEQIFRNLQQRPQGKLVLGYRKEFSAEIEDALKQAGVARDAVFLTHMVQSDIEEVVTGLTRPNLRHKYKLNMEAGLPSRIAGNLLADKTSPIAPVLQILLTKMWDKTSKTQPYFSLDLYEQLDREGLLLKDFLNQQLAEVGKWNAEVESSGLVLDVLNFHTTDLATANQRPTEEIYQRYPHRKDTIDKLVLKLKELYLLADVVPQDVTNEEKEVIKSTVLAHDTLAPLVQERFKNSEKLGQRASRLLDNQMREVEATKQLVLLDENDLKVVEQGQKGMQQWSVKEEELIQQSRIKKDKEEKERRIRQATSVITILVVIIASITGWWGYIKFEQNLVKSKANGLNALAREIAIDNPTVAFRIAEGALELDKENQELLTTLHTIYGRSEAFYLNNLLHKGQISSAVFSPDGSRILTAAWDSTARIWDATGKLLDSCKGHEGAVTQAIFSPNGSRILTTSSDRTAKIWDLNGKLQGTCTHDFQISSAVFSSDGSRILTASWDKTAKIWDSTGRYLATCQGHEAQISSVVFSHDGSRILTSSWDKTAKIWDSTGRCQGTYTHEDVVTSAVFSPNGNRILTASRDKTAKVWDSTGRCQRIYTHEDVVTSAVFSPNGTHILTTSKDKTAKIWDLEGTLLGSCRHENEIFSAVFSPDGSYVLTASKDKTARMWDLKGTLLATCKGHEDGINNAVFSPDGNHILTASDDKTAKIWDLKNTPLTTKADASNVVFSPDSSSILATNKYKIAKAWNLKGTLLASYKDWLSRAVFSPDGIHILTVSEDKIARIWDSTGILLATCRGHEDEISSAVFSPNGNRILTTSWDKTARVWDLNGTLLTVYKEASNAIFSSDGSYILITSSDGTAKLWKCPMILDEFIKKGKIAPLNQRDTIRYGLDRY